MVKNFILTASEKEKLEGKTPAKFVKGPDGAEYLQKEGAELLKEWNEDKGELVDVKEKRDEALIFEFLASRAYASFGLKSPEVELHKDKKGEVTLLSKLIKFEPIAEIGNNEKGEEFIKGKKTVNKEEYGEFAVANYYIGESDLGPNNVGSNFSRIDFGEALNVYKKGIRGEIPTTHDFSSFLINNRQNTVLTGGVIEGSPLSTDEAQKDLGILKEKEFLEGAQKFSDAFYIDKVRKSIHSALNEVKDAYGNEIFLDEKFKKECSIRLGIPEKTNLTPELIEEMIVLHMSERHKKLQNYIKEHKSQTIENRHSNETVVDRSAEAKKKLLKRRIFNKSLTDNDKHRLELVKNENLKKLKENGIYLSKKPSPLFIAIQTGQLDKAMELMNAGHNLKNSEVKYYRKKQQGDKVKKSIRSFLKNKSQLMVQRFSSVTRSFSRAASIFRR